MDNGRWFHPLRHRLVMTDPGVLTQLKSRSLKPENCPALIYMIGVSQETQELSSHHTKHLAPKGNAGYFVLNLSSSERFRDGFLEWVVLWLSSGPQAEEGH